MPDLRPDLTPATVDAARLPNFFVIGANRAGTTSLHDYLGQHPQVFMSPNKEPGYFAPKSDEERALWPGFQAPITTLDEYRALFAGATDERAVGESSTAYLTSARAPALIRGTVPDAKLVAVLRNPADRAFSDYELHRSWGNEALSFADAVAAELDHEGPVAGRMRGYVMSGFYGRSLRRYLEHFPRDQLGVWLYDDLVADPGALVRAMFAFLEVDPAVPVDTTSRRNERYEPRHRIIDRIARSRGVRAATRRVMSSGIRVRMREGLRRVNRAPVEYPEAVRERLVALYRDDIARTEDIIGRDLSAWVRACD